MPQIRVIKPFDLEQVGTIIFLDEKGAEQKITEGVAELVTPDSPVQGPVVQEQAVEETSVPGPATIEPVQTHLQPETPEEKAEEVEKITKIEVHAEGAES